MDVSWLVLVFLCRTAATLDMRLPSSIVPIHYDVRIDSDASSPHFTFKGRTVIDVLVTNSTDRIIVHAVHLTMDRNSVAVEELAASGAQRISVTDVGYDAERELVAIELATCLKANRYFRVSIDYNATVEHTLRGFYRSFYHDRRSNQKKSLTLAY